MSDLTEFKKFGKKKATQKEVLKDVWCYTRVSSIGQEDNFSLEGQKQFAINYAEKKGYNPIKFFGGTYESAKDDFTRKEFNKLIHSVRKANRKPFGIIVYKMSRFSRTGGGGISLVNELVEKLGVHLIEAVSDIDTSTDKGQLAIYNKLLYAREENISRLEHTIPGMILKLKNGNKIGASPPRI